MAVCIPCSIVLSPGPPYFLENKNSIKISKHKFTLPSKKGVLQDLVQGLISCAKIYFASRALVTFSGETILNIKIFEHF